jgi:hypothetical protein
MSMVEDLASISTLAEDLKASTVAVRLRVNRWGVKRALDDPQNMRAANEFDALSEMVSASKKLINTKHPSYRAVGKAINKARQYWIGMTVPYPEDGMRLLRTSRVSEFENGLDQIRSELREALDDFETDFWRIKNQARIELGDLFCEEDYPNNVIDLFRINHEYSDVNPARHLMELHPEIYAREQARVRQRFEQAIELAEAAFVEELNGLLEHCIERLTDADGSGKAKKFNDSLVGNFREFAERFSKLDINSNNQLTGIVNQIKALTNGLNPDVLRKSSSVRDVFREHMETVKQTVSGMIVDRPKRRFAD